MLHLCVARIAPQPDAEAAAWLGAAERQRLAGLAPAAGAAFEASRGLLRRLLAQATGASADGWELSAQAGRAPVASRRDDARAAGPAVSLAHRLGWVAAAVSDVGPVGIDVECERPVRSPPEERAALMLCDEELAAWRALPAAAREPALLRAWVAKEAWFKASPAGEAPWDFRRVAAREAAPAEANVRVWHAPPVWVALCCADAGALAAAACEGLERLQGEASESSWRVGRLPVSP